MLKRSVLLCLGLWVMVAAAMSAHAGPCEVRAETPEIAAATPEHTHCDMKAAPTLDLTDEEQAPDHNPACCCPAVLAAFPFAQAPEFTKRVYASAVTFPADMSAPSREINPEPRPPKA